MARFYIDPNIARAKTLDTQFYNSPAIFEESKERIFRRSWQFIGDKNSFGEPGQCFPLTLLEKYLDEPLVLTRDQRKEVHCLSNVCTHRGTIVVNGPCK